jgi:mRNA interferase RelE/StbE
MKTVRYTSDAAKDLRRHANMAARLRAAIEGYAANPLSHANRVTDLVGRSGKRMRVGDFRILFEETDAEILVTKVGARGDVYD